MSSTAQQPQTKPKNSKTQVTAHILPGKAPSEPKETFAYTIRPIVLPPPPLGPVLPQPLKPREGSSNYDTEKKLPRMNLAYFSKIRFVSGAVNDKGDVAFAIMWTTNNQITMHGGVYAFTEWDDKANDYKHKRKVAEIGKDVAGHRLYDVQEVRINNNGKVSYRANITGSGNPAAPESDLIFVEDTFAMRGTQLPGKPDIPDPKDRGDGRIHAGLCVGRGKYILGEDGKAYLPGNWVDAALFTTDGANWYKIQGAQPKPDGLNHDLIDQVPVLPLPDDVAQQIGKPAKEISLSVLNNIPGKGVLGNQAGDLRTEVGLIARREQYNTNRGASYYAYTANGLRIAAGGFSNQMNSAGQILINALPLPDDTRLFGFVLATPGNSKPESNSPQPGDIVLYRKGGKIAHSGVVTQVDANGNVMRVASKWGEAGLYSHAPDAVPPVYGEWEVYHTDRGNNALRVKKEPEEGKPDSIIFVTDNMSEILPEPASKHHNITLARAEELISAEKPDGMGEPYSELVNKKLFPIEEMPTALYNCHGFTFGSRKAWITDSKIEVILKENGYCRIAVEKHASK